MVDRSNKRAVAQQIRMRRRSVRRSPPPVALMRRLCYAGACATGVLTSQLAISVRVLASAGWYPGASAAERYARQRRNERRWMSPVMLRRAPVYLRRNDATIRSAVRLLARFTVRDNRRRRVNAGRRMVATTSPAPTARSVFWRHAPATRRGVSSDGMLAGREAAICSAPSHA